MISLKLKDVNIVGSDKSICKYSKKNLQKLGKGRTVIISSSTEKHLADLENCLQLRPKVIYVEKGFSSIEEYSIAKKISEKVPVYILSQYRFSAVFKILRNHLGVKNFKKINYTWKIDKSVPSEWAFHIFSIDNYLKNKNNKMLIQNYGDYSIDSISSFSITESDTRSMVIDIETAEYKIKITLGTHNTLSYKEDGNELEKHFVFQNEDCLHKQLRDIFLFKDNSIIERL